MAEDERRVLQFQGLPMADLIGGPLNVASAAQVAAAKAQADFLKTATLAPPAEDEPAKDDDA